MRAMRVAIDTAVFGLLPVPVTPDAAPWNPERHRPDRARWAVTGTSLERARIRFSLRNLAYQRAAGRRMILDFEDSEWARH